MASNFNGDEINVLFHSCEKGELKIVKSLIERDRIDVNVSDEYGNTALQVAAANDQVCVHLAKDHFHDIFHFTYFLFQDGNPEILD